MKKLDTVVDMQQRFNGQSVFYKIDWLTVVYQQITLRQLIESYFSESIDEAFDVFTNWGEYVTAKTNVIDVKTMTYRGVRFALANEDYFSLKDSDRQFFNVVLSRVVVDVTGEGCNYLANKGYQSFCDFTAIGDYHFTRCDFAFDFIDCYGDFLKRELDYFKDSGEVYFGRAKTLGATKPRNSRWVVSKGLTHYLGSRQSDSMIRIYDKLVEYTNKMGGLLHCPYTVIDDVGVFHLPQSWIRFELTLKDSVKIQAFVDQQITTNGIFRYILSNFSVLNGEGKVIECWQELYDSCETLPIIQNANFAPFKSRYSRAKSFVKRNQFSYGVVAANEGLGNMHSQLQKWVQVIQLSDDPKDKVTWVNFYKSCNEEGRADFLVYDKFTGLWNLV